MSGDISGITIGVVVVCMAIVVAVIIIILVSWKRKNSKNNATPTTTQHRVPGFVPSTNFRHEAADVNYSAGEPYSSDNRSSNPINLNHACAMPPIQPLPATAISCPDYTAAMQTPPPPYSHLHSFQTHNSNHNQDAYDNFAPPAAHRQDTAAETANAQTGNDYFELEANANEVDTVHNDRNVQHGENIISPEYDTARACYDAVHAEPEQLNPSENGWRGTGANGDEPVQIGHAIPSEYDVAKIDEMLDTEFQHVNALENDDRGLGTSGVEVEQDRVNGDQSGDQACYDYDIPPNRGTGTTLSSSGDEKADAQTDAQGQPREDAAESIYALAKDTAATAVVVENNVG